MIRTCILLVHNRKAKRKLASKVTEHSVHIARGAFATSEKSAPAHAPAHAAGTHGRPPALHLRRAATDPTAPTPSTSTNTSTSPSADAAANERQLGKNTLLMSVLVMISRITGFVRTWAQAYALGVTVLASCYSVANNLPNQLYELVVGGMLVTAFLPVYLSVKKKLGTRAASDYASNLVSIVLLLMGLVCVVGFIFAYQVVYTQSFSAHSEFNADLCVYFFRFFAIEVVLYALSSIFSGVLNAERDYFWSSAAPIFNNVVTITSFFLYSALAATHSDLALLCLALGNPLGVLIQVVMQMPSLARHGIHLRLYINFKDPALKETLGIGVGSLVVMACAFATVSVQTSSALSVSADGASVAFYARLWFTLPYAIIAVPITTALFTELSHDIAARNIERYKTRIVEGTCRVLFFMIPCMMLLMLFAIPLVRFMAAGKFTHDNIIQTSWYLFFLSAALPSYAVAMYLQKVCSSLRVMMQYAAFVVIGSILQILVCLWATPLWGLCVPAASSVVIFSFVDIACFIMLHLRFSHIGILHIVASCLRGIVFGALGVFAAYGVLFALHMHALFFDAGVALSLAQLFAYICLSGIAALVVCFGGAFVLRVPELRMFLARRRAQVR